MEDVPPHCLAVAMRDCLASSSCFLGSSIVFGMRERSGDVVSHAERQ